MHFKYFGEKINVAIILANFHPLLSENGLMESFLSVAMHPGFTRLCLKNILITQIS